jgi:hypothetical protein
VGVDSVGLRENTRLFKTKKVPNISGLDVGVEGFEPKTLPIASGGSEPAFKIAYKKGKKNQLRISWAPSWINRRLFYFEGVFPIFVYV